MTRRGWIVVATTLLGLSVAALWLVSVPSQFGSLIWRAARHFGGPGIAIWWLTLGGPFQTTPRTTWGVIWGAIANAVFWFVLLFLTYSATRKFVRLLRVRRR